MLIKFLGTGTSQGVPVIGCECEVCMSKNPLDKRLRSSIFLETEEVNIVIDTGPDFRQQMLRENIKRLDAVIFTHEHKDHTAGLDDIRSFNFLQKQSIPVYGRKQVLHQIKQEYAYIFKKHKYPGIPSLTLHEIENSPFEIKGLKITPIEVMHKKLPVYGYRVGDFTYITDANYIFDIEKDKIRGSHTLVLNALQKSPHISHFTLDEALELMQEMDVKRGFFTHISHKLGLHEKENSTLPPHIQLASDGLEINLNG